MTPIPLERRAVPRRHRSRQREQILAWVRASDCHPTASEIHDALRPAMPSLSLGTVYRNLEVLVGEGRIDPVSSAVGPTRYDGNVEPHHHFHCEACGRIVDVDLPAPRSLTRRLIGEHGLRARRVRVDFFGLCAACEPLDRDSSDRAAAARPGASAQRSGPERQPGG